MRYHCLENKDTDKTENKESDSPQANSWNLFARKTEKVYLHDTKE